MAVPVIFNIGVWWLSICLQHEGSMIVVQYQLVICREYIGVHFIGAHFKHFCDHWFHKKLMYNSNVFFHHLRPDLKVLYVGLKVKMI